MSDELEREITTKKVTSNPNTSVDGYRVTEQQTTRVSNDNSASALILGVLLTLGLGAGAVIYYLNNRPAPSQILVPQIIKSEPNVIRENKSTVIERNNTTTKEVAPATPQSAPNVQINVPAPAATTQPQTATPAPTNPAATPTPSPAN
jgi:hypothetical protein